MPRLTILALCLALPTAAAQAQPPGRIAVNDPPDAIAVRGREHWDHFASSLLTPRLNGVSSIDISIEPASTTDPAAARDRRAAIILYTSPPGHDIRISDVRYHDAKAIDVGGGWLHIAGLPAGVLGAAAGDRLLLAMPAEKAMRAKGRLIVQRGDRAVAREFGVYRFGMKYRSIDSPEPDDRSKP